MKRLSIFFIVILLTASISNKNAFGNLSVEEKINNSTFNPDKELAFVTYVSNDRHERFVRNFIKGLRELTGKYKNSKVFIVLGDEKNFPCKSINGDNRVYLVSVEADNPHLDYPLAIKAYAAAQVEKLLKGKVRSLVWVDPGVLVLNEIKELDLKNGSKLSAKAVSLTNNIALKAGTEPDEYWALIYSKTNLDFKKIPTLKTIVDEVDIQAYYNCEVFSIDPSLGILSEWAELLTEFLENKKYQEKACSGYLKKLFLHQAVLSCLINSKISLENIKTLPITSGYPFNSHDRLADDKKVKSFEELSVVIFDYAWERIPTWMDKIEINNKLKDWLFHAYIDYLKLGEHLYRIEGSSNSYLVITKEGSVMIDPAGASVAPEYFEYILKEHPLKAILLTHCHQDHSDSIAFWRKGKTIPVIAQREFKEYFNYQERLTGHFSRRNAIWRGEEPPEKPKPRPNSRYEPTIYFSDDYEYELGGIHFKMIHTPGETPDHTTIWVPELKAAFIGDNYYRYFINNSTFRGTMIRPVLGYIRALDTALSFNSEYFLMGHLSPILGKQKIKKTVGDFRDALKFIHDETVKGINEGKDMYTLMKEIKGPEGYQIGEYFGKISWTVRGIYQEYVGWFDGNPASMYETQISDLYPDIVQLAGGVENINKHIEILINDHKFVKALYLTDIALKTSPNEKESWELRLRVLQALRQGPYNYIQFIFLDDAIKKANKKLKEL